MGTVLAGLDAKSNERLLRDLGTLNDNLRGAINRNQTQQQEVAAG